MVSPIRLTAGRIRTVGHGVGIKLPSPSRNHDKRAKLRRCPIVLHQPPAGQHPRHQLSCDPPLVRSQVAPIFWDFQISRMSSTSLSQVFNSGWVIGGRGDSHSCKRFQESCVGSLSVGLVTDTRSYVGKINRQYYIFTEESTLILMRHGESMWNEKNLFTGCVDVPLTSKGVKEAIEAGKRISSLPFDIIYTSALIRAQMTTMLALTQHRCMKVRELQGLNKQETAEQYGKKQVHNWRRSYHVRPPNGESLEMCLGRAVTFFKEHIEPQLLSGMHVMVVAHANSLRSIIMYLDKLTSQEVINLELSTGVPMLYIYREGNFIRRGSPVGSSEAGVYAYTEV
ncbi:UNVERIFIED_CONTAM: 2,3-bisphosphoglycerate-dependent phosphoglycerate mutase [Sesamum angustifolium]|uniref:Phosphoglycerate mutase n=1 Tax=Sesamum angustifolium TaxID=2727405 RepID=A0AAW2NPG7_9LAMI